MQLNGYAVPCSFLLLLRAFSIARVKPNAPMTLPSIDKGKHACQRVFPALFALFALAGASPPASQKPKITRRSIAGRCGQFCRSRNVSRQGKARREYCRIVKGLDAVWAHFCPSKPCLPLSIDGIDDGDFPRSGFLVNIGTFDPVNESTENSRVKLPQIRILLHGSDKRPGFGFLLLLLRGGILPIGVRVVRKISR